MDFDRFPNRIKVKSVDKTTWLMRPEASNIVYTPGWVVENMLDLLPKEIWSNPEVKFLDPCCKSGIFLDHIYWRLYEGLKDIIQDRIDRSDHILTKQLFGLASNDVQAEISRSVLYGTSEANHRNAFTTRFKDAKGNIKTLEIELGENWYDFSDIIKERTGELFKMAVKEAFGNMKFDVIIGNPPYQEETGGGGRIKDARPLYNEFVEKALMLGPRYLTMIIPSRWMCGGKPVLDSFRTNMLSNKHLVSIYDFEKSKDVFGDLDIAGGVMYFLIDMTSETTDVCEVNNCRVVDGKLQVDSEKRELNLYTYLDNHDKVQYMIVRNNKADRIVRKIRSVQQKYMDEFVQKVTVFGVPTNFRDSDTKTEHKNIKVVCSYGRVTYTDMNRIRGIELLDKYKVITGSVSPDTGRKNEAVRVINPPNILKPGEICTNTYLVLGVTDTEQEAINMAKYMENKFVRYLISVTLTGMNITSRNLMFVPMQDFTKPWTDEELYAKYNLTQEEIDLIESTIKPME